MIGQVSIRTRACRSGATTGDRRRWRTLEKAIHAGARNAPRAPACIAFSRVRHRLRSPVVAPLRQALVRMLTWPIISAGKSKRPTFTAKAIANYGRDCALPGFARALAGCAG